MKGIGVDIFCLNRIDLTHRKTIERILSKKELEIFDAYPLDQTKKEFFGGRFCAKEAYVKASGQKLPYNQIEVLNDETGKPFFTNLEGMVSISHEKEYAIAFVVIE